MHTKATYFYKSNSCKAISLYLIISFSLISARLFATVGCHPTRCKDFLPDAEAYLQSLRDLISKNADKVVAIGECGLDYDRLNFCDKDVQLK